MSERLNCSSKVNFFKSISFKWVLIFKAVYAEHGNICGSSIPYLVKYFFALLTASSTLSSSGFKASILLITNINLSLTCLPPFFIWSDTYWSKLASSFIPNWVALRTYKIKLFWSPFIALYVVFLWAWFCELFGPGVSTSIKDVSLASKNGISPCALIKWTSSFEFNLSISSYVRLSVDAIFTFASLYTTAVNWSLSLSKISVIVAVHASFLDGINLFPNNELINVDFPELIVAITLIGNIVLFTFSNALINLGSLKSSTGPFCKSLNISSIFTLISSSDLPSIKFIFKLLIIPFFFAWLNESSKSS